jgi:hypothetical protein
MAVTNLTDDELHAFLENPKGFLANKDNLARVVGLTPSTMTEISRRLAAQGMTPDQINSKMGAVMRCTEIVKELVKEVIPIKDIKGRVE